MSDLWAGEFGRYQWRQYLLHLLPAFTAGVQVLSQVEVGATPNHRCAEVNDTILDYVGSCHYLSVTNETVACTAWEYNRTYYQSTIVTDWNLVCDQRWLAAVAQSTYMLGSLIANTLLGQLADRYGRWKILVPTGALQMIFAIASGFVRNYYFYLIIRFITAVNVGGSFVVGFVLTLEMAPDRYRTYIGFFYQTVFAFGIMAVAGCSYLISDWPLLQIVLGLLSLPLLLYYWLVDESPRWLFTQGRYEEAEAILRKMLILNGRSELIPEEGYSIDRLRQALSSTTTKSSDPVEPVDRKEEDENKKTTTTESVKTEYKHGIVDLFRTPRLRWRTINIVFNWFANSLVYYGLSLSTGSLVGNPHLMLFISGLVEVPAYLLSARFIDILGRRPIISFCLVFGGLACICTPYFPQNDFTWETATICTVMMAKALISVSFSTVYNYTVELFPTVVRSSAIGISGSFAVFSSTITPLIFLMDSLDPKIPLTLFGVAALMAGIFSLDLPETMEKPLLQTLVEGEEFGIGDTCFLKLCADNNKRQELTFANSSVELFRSQLQQSSS